MKDIILLFLLFFGDYVAYKIGYEKGERQGWLNCASWRYDIENKPDKIRELCQKCRLHHYKNHRVKTEKEQSK